MDVRVLNDSADPPKRADSPDTSDEPLDPRPDDDRSSAAGGQRDYRRHLTAP
jgi:hypothetical protein